MISSHFCHRHQRLLVHVEDVGKAGEEPGEEQGGHASDEHIAVFLPINETCKQCLTRFDIIVSTMLGLFCSPPTAQCPGKCSPWRSRSSGRSRASRSRSCSWRWRSPAMLRSPGSLTSDLRVAPRRHRTQIFYHHYYTVIAQTKWSVEINPLDVGGRFSI